MAAWLRPLTARCMAEVLGTFILIFFGCGAVHTAVILGAQAGVWQVAIVWGVAIMIAVYVVGGISGAHINPAVTVSMAVWRKLPWAHVAPYIASQMVGAMLAAAVLFALFHPQLTLIEKKNGIKRGQPGSELTASCYCEFYPNPGAGGVFEPSHFELYKKRNYRELNNRLCGTAAFAAEVLGTLLLALVVFALTDTTSNSGAPPGHMAPVFIGLTVAIIISVLGPLTQACLNPARDWGPRVVASVAGWGKAALPGPNGIGSVTVYIIAPLVGGILGGGVYQILRPNYLPGSEPSE